MIATESTPDAVRRAVGFEIVAQSLSNLGEDWAASSELYNNFAERIKEESLSGGMSEELWDTSRQTLLSERETASSSWLQVDFFPGSTSANNNTTTGSSDTAEVKPEPDKAIVSSPATKVTPDINSNLPLTKEEVTSVKNEETNEEAEDLTSSEDVADQESLITKAVPILFEALHQYGEISEQGSTVELEGKRNKITWSILDKKLSVTGKEYLEISFDSNKQVVSYESNLSQDYVEHLEDQVVSKLSQQANHSIER